MTRLEFIRKEKGLTQKALAEKILYSKTAICRIERCHVLPEEISARLADALERYWGEPIEQLIAPLDVAEPQADQKRATT